MMPPAYEQIVPFPPDLSAACTDEELLAWVKQRYFTTEELAEAERLLEERGYEQAIAYLARVGQESLRNSGEAQAPHLFITIPGGKLFIFRPGRPIGAWTGHLPLVSESLPGSSFPSGLERNLSLTAPLDPSAECPRYGATLIPRSCLYLLARASNW